MNILKSKTIWFSILLAVFGVVEANVAVLRVLTTVPLSEK